MILASTMLALALPGLAQRGPGRNMRLEMGSGTNHAVISSLPKQNLDATEVEGLNYLCEEEKLARDIYVRFHSQWGTRIFENISQSEHRHFEALQVLLERYGLPDPAANMKAGNFQNPELQKLYGDLVLQGATSLSAALRVGATIEDLDLHNLEKALALTDNEDLKIVYQNLQQGSQNHMRAFVSNLESMGESYEAQYISAAALTEILAKSSNSGNRFGRGRNGQKGLMHGNSACPCNVNQ